MPHIVFEILLCALALCYIILAILAIIDIINDFISQRRTRK